MNWARRGKSRSAARLRAAFGVPASRAPGQAASRSTGSSDAESGAGAADRKQTARFIRFGTVAYYLFCISIIFSAIVGGWRLWRASTDEAAIPAAVAEVTGGVPELALVVGYTEVPASVVPDVTALLTVTVADQATVSQLATATAVPSHTPLPTETARPIDTAVPTAARTLRPTRLPTMTQVPLPTETQVPTNTPLPTATLLAATRNSTNLRSGPGTTYAIRGTMVKGDSLVVVGKNSAGTWLALDSGLWIIGSQVTNPPGNVAVLPDPPTPVPAATAAPTNPPVPTAPPMPTAVPVVLATAEPPTIVPPTSVPQPAPTAVPAPVAQCDSNYSGVCVPVVGYDLDCKDIPAKRFQSTGSDPHGLDRDKDGVACES